MDLFVDGTLHLARGEMTKATWILEDLISKSPLVNTKKEKSHLYIDILALRICHDCYFYLGKPKENMDSIARVVDQVRELYDQKMYGYVLGMYAFGLEETGQYEEAEKAGRYALQINPNDAWAVHAVTHVMEMQGRQEEGIEFLSSREKDWVVCPALACHNYWHWGLHLIELGRFEEAIQLFDREIAVRIQSGAMLDMVDGASFLFRLQFEQVQVGERWKDVRKLFQDHLGDHVYAFNDVHMALSETRTNNKFVETLAEYLQNYSPDTAIDNLKVTKLSGNDIIHAILAFNEKEYQQTSQLLGPIIQQEKLILIGGSHAQRDLFQLILIHATVNAGQYAQARQLLDKRKRSKPTSGLTDRLINKLTVLQNNC